MWGGLGRGIEGRVTREVRGLGARGVDTDGNHLL